MQIHLISKCLQRVSVSVRFRLQPLVAWYRRRVVGPVRGKHGTISRQLEYPLGFFSPNRKKELFVARPSALGDVLLCTPALREFKKQNPNTKIKFFTNYETLVKGLPYIDEVMAYDQRPWDGIEFRYEDSIQPSRHIAKIFGDQLNLEVTDTLPDCVFPTQEMESFKLKYSNYPRPWIVLNRKAGPWTPNKDWNDAYWDDLLPKLLSLGTVFELGNGKPTLKSSDPNYINLVGSTTLSEMVAVIASSDVNIGPDSGPVHIAAAVRVPSIAIFGGYVPVSCFGYSNNINLSSQLDCSPCWLRTPCPIDKKCLSEITPDQVFKAALRLFSGSRVSEKIKKIGYSIAPSTINA